MRYAFLIHNEEPAEGEIPAEAIEEMRQAFGAYGRALQEAGVFAIVLEMVPAPVAERVTAALDVPTIGIGAGAGCDGQVLVWPDMAGLSSWSPRFAKAYGSLRSDLADAARAYNEEVRSRTFPAPEHTFEK